MGHRPLLVCAVLAVPLMGAPALAQEDRYQLERTEDGYVRLDTRTGRMSLCRQQEERLVCRAAAEDLAAYDTDVETLRERLDALETRLAVLESGRPAADLPSEEEFEQSLGYMERFLRRFMGIVREFEGGSRDTPDEPAPDRT